MPDSNQREVEQRWTGDVLSREIAAGGSVDPGAPPSRSRSALAHSCPTPLEGFEGLVVCWNLFGDADHHTVEEAFRRSGRQSFAIYRETIRKKEAALYLLALWNANRKLAEGSKSTAN
jgi:hypothetical protein